MVAPSLTTPVPKNPYAAVLAWGITIAVGLTTMVYLYHQIKLSKLQIQKHEKDPAAHT